jgi:hypothetical protein
VTKPGKVGEWPVVFHGSMGSMEKIREASSLCFLSSVLDKLCQLLLLSDFLIWLLHFWLLQQTLHIDEHRLSHDLQ